MKNRAITLALASSGLLLMAPSWADADISFSGFGTLGVTHSNNRQADFVGSILQPNGAGRSSSTMFGIDTKAGVQAQGKIGNDLTATVQVVSDHRFDNSYAPRFEWANLKYQITKDTYVRVGRVVAPVFMISDYRNIGYSQTPIRMPFDVYGLNPVSHLDGADIGTKFEIGGGTLNVQLTGGRVKEFKPMAVPDGTAVIQPTGSMKMANLNYEYGSSNFRVGFAKSRVAALNDYLSQMDFAYSLGALVGHPQNTIHAYQNIEVKLLDLGYAYDSGNWLAQSEYVSSKGGGNMSVDMESWYVLAGYRLGKFTPYASFSQLKSTISSDVASQPTAVSPCTPCILDQLAWGINATDASLRQAQEQRTISLGVRYDFYKNLALKAQFDQIKKPGSPSAPNKGMFAIPAVPVGSANLYPEFSVTNNTVNLVTLALDFVF